uniref:Uncharacterized protein n=1 Tax=Steinernema glaseri TaxID=37863 RepID=A0A1I7YCH1_9BILA
MRPAKRPLQGTLRSNKGMEITLKLKPQCAPRRDPYKAHFDPTKAWKSLLNLKPQCAPRRDPLLNHASIQQRVETDTGFRLRGGVDLQIGLVRRPHDRWSSLGRRFHRSRLLHHERETP